MIDRLLYKFLGGVKYASFKGVTIGEGCRILTRRFGSEPWLISIGNKVTISSDVVFVNHDGSGWLHSDHNGRRYRYARIDIGDNAFIGSGSIILPGVKIGSNCVVGAGSVVSRSIPAGTVVAGNPARYICQFSEFISKLDGWSTEQDMTGATRRERIDSIVESFYKPELKSETIDVG